MSAEALAGYTAAPICTDHDAVDYGPLESYPGLIVDTCKAMAGRRS